MKIGKYEFTWFNKKLLVDFSQFNELIKLLKEGRIIEESIICVNSPERLKGRFTYIEGKKKKSKSYWDWVFWESNKKYYKCKFT